MQPGWIPPAQQGWNPPPQQGFGPVPGSSPPPVNHPPPQPWGDPSQYPGQSPYWTSPTQSGSSPLALAGAIALLLLGILVMLFGLVFLLVGAAGPEFLVEMEPTLAGEQADLITSFSLGLGAVLLVVGILEIIASIGIFLHKGWARWLGVVLAVIGLFVGFLLILASFVPSAGGGDFIVSLMWLGAHAFVAAALAAGGDHFRPAYPGR